MRFDFGFHSEALEKGELIPVRITGREHISQIYSFDIDLVAAQPLQDIESVLSKPVALSVSADGRSSYIQGIICRFGQGARSRDYVHYTATLVPRLWSLGQRYQSQIYQELTVPDIIGAELEAAGLPGDAMSMELAASYPEREYVVQYQESDLQFISRLAEHEGIAFFFRQSEDGEKLVFSDANQVFPNMDDEDNKVPFRPRSGMASQEEVAVQRFICEWRRVPDRVQLTDYNYRHPQLDLNSEDVGEEGPDTAGFRREYGDHYLTADEGKRLAKVRREEARVQSKMYHGESTVPGLRPGHVFSLSEHDSPEFDGEYLVVSVTHHGRQPASGVVPDGVAGDEAAHGVPAYHNTFVAIPADIPYRPPRRTPKPRVPGVINGWVQGLGDGPRGEVDKQGRYKVKVPFDPSGRTGDKASRYIRMAQPYAGAHYGTHLPLHAGTEVVWTCVNGDPDRPIISGAVPNPITPSPVTQDNATECVVRDYAGNEWIMDGKEAEKRILFRQPCSNQLLMREKDGDEQVFLYSKRNLDVRNERDAFTWVGRDRHSIIGRDRREHIKTDRHDTIDRDHQAKIGRDRHVKVVGKSAEEVGGSYSLTVKGAAAYSYKQDLTTNATGAVSLKGREVVVEGMTSLTLKVGGSSVVVDASGVTVKGPQVILDGGMTRINSGPGSPPGTAKSANAVSPAAPEAPDPAASPDPHEMEDVKEKREHAKVKGKGGEELQPFVPPQPGSSESEDEKKSWIEIELVDEDGNPVPGERYRVLLPDGSTYASGTLDENGFARVDGIDSGECEVTFPDLDKEAWEPA